MNKAFSNVFITRQGQHENVKVWVVEDDKDGEDCEDDKDDEYGEYGEDVCVVENDKKRFSF